MKTLKATIDPVKATSAMEGIELIVRYLEIILQEPTIESNINTAREQTSKLLKKVVELNQYLLCCPRSIEK